MSVLLPSCSSSPSIASLIHSKISNNPRTLRQIHGRLIRTGLESNGPVSLRFLTLCSSVFSLRYSITALIRLPSPSPHHFNSILKSVADQRCFYSSSFSVAFSLFARMRKLSSCPPDEFTFPSLFRVCARESAFFTGSALHATVVELGLDNDPFVCTSLIHFYGKNQSLGSAKLVFDAMELKNEVSWTSMMSACVDCGCVEDARQIFDKMPKRNLVTWNVMIDGFVKAGDLVNARNLFDQMPEKNAVSFTSLIDGYAKAGDMVSARSLFERMDKEDLHCWSVMISGYVQNGRPGEALKVFLEMYGRNIRPDEFVVVGLMSACSQLGSLTLAKWVDSYIAHSAVDVKRPHVLASLIDMHAKCGNMDQAAVLFSLMENRDLVSFCSMMQGYSIHGEGAKAVDLFCQMLEQGLSPDEVAFTVVLAACSHAGLVEEGKKYFHMMKDKYDIAPSADHYACMVDLLGRSGRIMEAYELLQSTLVEPHAGAWGALLGACRQHSDIELGEAVARRLFELEPQNAGNFVLLSNIYAAADKWSHVSRLRTMMRGRGLRKIPGCTWM